MSEEKRFTNKKLIVVSIILILVSGMTGVLGFMFISTTNNYNDLSGDYDDLYVDYLELLFDFNTLDNQYSILTGEHIELENDYNILVIALADMTVERDGLLAQIDILNAEISVHLATILDLNIQISDLEAEIVILEAQAVVDSETIADLNAQIVVLNGEITNYLATISGLEVDLANMTALRDDLEIDLNTLQLQYNDLLGDYQILLDAKDDLQTIYDVLLIAYDYICNTIKQSILPVQYSIFAEAVRRYYMPIYLDGLTPKEWYIGYTELCRDIVLHDSGQYNAFTEVSNAFSDALRFGSDTMYLAYSIMTYVFWSQLNTIHWLPNWDGWDLTGDELTDINTIVDWNIDEIDYEYDSDINLWQEDPTWDYPKFPVETAFRTMGDCEDQAILTAAYLESCGFETALVVFHDPYHPTLGDFYHCVPLVHIENTDVFKSLYYPECPLWRFTNGPYYPNYTWSWLDTTWDVPFGSTPTWLTDYSGSISFSYCSIAFCDVDGNIGENTGLTCVMPT